MRTEKSARGDPGEGMMERGVMGPKGAGEARRFFFLSTRMDFLFVFAYSSFQKSLDQLVV